MSVSWLFDVIQSRRENPSESSYTSRLLAEGLPSTLLFRDLLFASLAAGIVGYFCIGLVHRATSSGWWHRFAWYCWLAALVLVGAAQ